MINTPDFETNLYYAENNFLYTMNEHYVFTTTIGYFFLNGHS